jgi:hypothetical protein
MAKREEITTGRYLFSGGLEGRDSTTTKDQRFVNMYPETVKGRTLLVKRPGLTSYFTNSSGVGRGTFAFNSHVWSVIGDTLYMDTTVKTTLATSTGVVGFTACTSSGLPRLFICDGTDGYVVDTTNAVTQITDVDFPSPHIPTPVYIDGYVCLIRADSADIYNCDLEDPTAWTASNFITSELYPDELVALAKQNNQIVAFGINGTEFFYNNGANQPTGTPLARNQGAALQIGNSAPYAIGQNEQNCFFISQSDSGGRAVWKMTGFTPEKISSQSVERVLDYVGTGIDDTTGYLLRLVGHLFFVVCLPSRTLVYDDGEKQWHEWTSTNQTTVSDSQIDGDDINGIGINGDSTTGDAFFNTTEWKWSFATDIGDGTVYLLNADTGEIAKFDRSKYVDIDQIIRCEINTNLIDFGSVKRKFIHRLGIVSDLATNNIFIKWSDNDYQTWSNTKIINMETRPVLHRLGATRRRAFNIYYTDNYPLRLEGLEFVVSEGEA